MRPCPPFPTDPTAVIRPIRPEGRLPRPLSDTRILEAA
ncbi:MAG: hypothetical protein RIQ53_4416 [Pseudomonadota bacterium]|jgi:hypothetical protein